jgi:undecaprenyl-diphosphatase
MHYGRARHRKLICALAARGDLGQFQQVVQVALLLSAPVILAAGMLKIPGLFGPLGRGIGGQVLAASLLSGVGAYLSIRSLARYFSKSRTLVPFAVYCLAASLGSLIYLTLR